MGATGLATTPDEYRRRLLEQPDEQLDAWAAEAMRDISIRRGVLAVLHDLRASAGLDDHELEKVFAAAATPAVVGHDADGRLMVGGHAPLGAGPAGHRPGARETLVSTSSRMQARLRLIASPAPGDRAVSPSSPPADRPARRDARPERDVRAAGPSHPGGATSPA
jgi:hypothetical protein